MIELFHYPLSPCGEKVRFCLVEKGIPWRERLVDLGNKENLRPEYLRLNPKGYVPTLIDNDVVLNESTIINEYLDDRYAELPLKPASAEARARMRRWTKLVDEVLHPAWPGIAWPILVRPAWLAKTPADVEAMLAKLLDPARRERQRRMYERGLDAPDFRVSLEVFSKVLTDMERTLANTTWLAGDTFSLADIAVFPYPFAASAFGLASWIDAHGRHVASWRERISMRPAIRRLIETGFPQDRMSEVARLGAEAVARLDAAASF